MTHYLTSDEMLKIDHYTMKEIGIPSLVLMERAAFSVFLDLQKNLTKDESILVVAGSGNNGGDAVALARMLFLEGNHVHCYIIDSENYSESMAQQVLIAENIGLPIVHTLKSHLFEEASIIIDGIFGIGLSREIEGQYKEVIHLINQQRKSMVIALDIPSGLSATTGEPFQTVVQADTTYAFGFKKHGMQKKFGQALCGKIIVCSIGYPLHRLEHFF